jgi:uncharacterized membrane protein
MATWKRDAASGLVVLVPLIITAYVVVYLYDVVANLPFLQQIQPGSLRVAVTLVVFVFLVFAVGYLMRTALGRVVESAIDGVMNRLPGLRVVYNASKMAVETALTGTDELQTPVKLEPMEGMRMTAFKTGQRAEDGREVVFLPTAPNITSGLVIEVPSERIEENDEQVEEALTRILSAGFGGEDSGLDDLDLNGNGDQT